MRDIDIDLIGVPVFILDVDSDGGFRVCAINRADEEAVGVRADDVIGRRVEACVAPDFARHIIARCSECVAKRALHEYDERLQRDGGLRWLRTTLTPVVDPASGRVVRIVGVSVDITQRKAEEGALTEAAFRDPLTGLANRRRLVRSVETTIAQAPATGRGFGLAVIDLDGFKPINDTYGHRRGDDVLRHIGSLLSLTVERDEVVARLGGDEFALKLFAASPAELHHRANALGRLLDRDVTIAEQRMRIGASVGCAAWTPGTTFEALFDRADAEMYRRKAERKAA
ncbi:GGDEF domain-containing protein [Methylorubrum sp. SB2]|uniref:GGDEF domain-containing protein n=1 Tax=Methylorubrum subtropicum TaxID=3138812 RepID=UPI00313D80F8